jgi:hypothetical protein
VTVRDPTARFDDRVDAYVQYRPGYPAEARHDEDLLHGGSAAREGGVIPAGATGRSSRPPGDSSGRRSTW